MWPYLRMFFRSFGIIESVNNGSQWFTNPDTKPHPVCFLMTGQIMDKAKRHFSVGHNPGSGLQNMCGFRNPRLATLCRN